MNFVDAIAPTRAGKLFWTAVLLSLSLWFGIGAVSDAVTIAALWAWFVGMRFLDREQQRRERRMCRREAVYRARLRDQAEAAADAEDRADVIERAHERLVEGDTRACRHELERALEAMA